MEVIKIIFYAIISIAFFVGFMWGFYYLMNKVFGVRFTSRYNYNNAVRMNALIHKQNLEELSEIDEETIKLAKEKLSKKFFTHTSDNIIEEVRKIQNNRPPQNDFVSDLTAHRSYELLNGHIYKMAPYCCYYNGITTYLKLLNNIDGIVAISRGEPIPENIDLWFNEANPNVMKFQFKYEQKNVIRFEVFHGGKKHGYDIFLKNADRLNVARWVPYGQTIIKLEFVLCK